MRILAAEIEKLVCDRLAVLFDDPVALVGQVHPGAALPECFTQLMAICRNTAGSQRSPDQTTIAGLIGALVRRIEVRHNGIAIMLDRRSIATLLKIDGPADGTPAIEIAVAVKLKRSGFALRLVLPNGNAALRQTDDRLLKTIATARDWGKQLASDPTLRIADLAIASGTTESWVTRVLRLAFLDPTIARKAAYTRDLRARYAPGRLSAD